MPPSRPTALPRCRGLRPRACMPACVRPRAQVYLNSLQPDWRFGPYEVPGFLLELYELSRLYRWVGGRVHVCVCVGKVGGCVRAGLGAWVRVWVWAQVLRCALS